MFKFWLWLHILSAIIAFGPTFAFPIIAAMMRKAPQHAAFAVHAMESITLRLTYPFALVLLPVAGIGLIFTAHIDFFGTTWLLVAVGIYLVAVAYSVGIQTPTAMKLVKLLDSMPPGPPPEGAGPPPEVAALGKRMQLGGIFLTLMVLVIFTLMIWQPGGIASTFGT